MKTFVVLFALFIGFTANAAVIIPGFEDGTYESTGRLRSQGYSWISTEVRSKVILRNGQLTASSTAYLWGFALWPVTTLRLQAVPAANNDVSYEQKYTIVDLNSGNARVGSAVCVPFDKCTINLSMFDRTLFLRESIRFEGYGLQIAGSQKYFTGPTAARWWRNRWMHTAFSGIFIRTN